MHSLPLSVTRIHESIVALRIGTWRDGQCEFREMHIYSYFVRWRHQTAWWIFYQFATKDSWLGLSWSAKNWTRIPRTHTLRSALWNSNFRQGKYVQLEKFIHMDTRSSFLYPPHSVHSKSAFPHKEGKQLCDFSQQSSDISQRSSPLSILSH